MAIFDGKCWPAGAIGQKCEYSKNRSPNGIFHNYPSSQQMRHCLTMCTEWHLTGLLLCPRDNSTCCFLTR
eukprot:scaffold586_cov155-Amphora_coffeaeformis.AAC.22